MSINKNRFNNNTIYTHLLGPGLGSFFLPAGIAKVTRKSITIIRSMLNIIFFINFNLFYLPKHSYIPLNGFHIYIYGQQQNKYYWLRHYNNIIILYPQLFLHFADSSTSNRKKSNSSLPPPPTTPRQCLAAAQAITEGNKKQLKSE